MKKRYSRNTKSKPEYKGLGAKELNLYLSSLRKQKYSPATILNRQGSILDFLGFLKSEEIDRLADIDTDVLESYRLHIVERGFRRNSVHGYLWGIKKFFQYLEESQCVFINPAAEFSVPSKNRDLLPVPTIQEMKKLLSMPDVLTPIGIRDRAILEVMYSTGVRRGELLGMKIFDPDFDHGRIKVFGKGSKERVVPLGKHSLHWLKEYMRTARIKIAKDNLDVHDLWLSKYSDPLSGCRLDQMIRQYVKNAGIVKPISAHSLRRACATHMLMNGAHPVQLQMLLGHSSLQTLSHYLQVGIREMMKTHNKTGPGK